MPKTIWGGSVLVTYIMPLSYWVQISWNFQKPLLISLVISKTIVYQTKPNRPKIYQSHQKWEPWPHGFQISWNFQKPLLISLVISKTNFYQTKPNRPKIYQNHQKWEPWPHGVQISWNFQNRLHLSKVMSQSIFRQTKPNQTTKNQTKNWKNYHLITIGSTFVYWSLLRNGLFGLFG